MKLLPFFFTAVLASTALAKTPVKFPELKLEDGTVLREVEVLRVEPDALRVEHGDGLRRIKMEKRRRREQHTMPK